MFFRYLKENVLGLSVAFLISLVVGLPAVWFHFSSSYQGVDMLKSNTEEHYVSQIQEVFDGYHWLGNDNYADLKNQPYLFPVLGPNLIWIVGKIFFLKAIPTVMLVRFLSSFFLAFILYRFVLYLTGNKVAAVVSMPFVMLAYGLVDPSNIISFFHTGVLPSEKVFLHYSRPINPEISSLFFFGYLLVFWRYLHEEKSSRWVGILSILLLGLSFYVYLFIWTFLYVFNGISAFYYVYKRDWKKVKKIILVSGIAFLISVFYWFNYWHTKQSLWYAETATRFGFVKHRTPSFSRLIFGCLVLFLFSFKIVSQRAREFFIPFFLTAIFVVNEQVITGYYIFNEHFHWNYNTPLAIICLVIILFSWLKKYALKSIYIYVITGILLAIFFWCGINEQRVSYAANLPAVIAEQRYAPVFNWLNTKTKKEDTVLASFGITDSVTALTHDNVYYNGTGIYTLLPTARLEHDYLVYRFLDGVSTSTFKDYLETHRGDISYFLFGYTYIFQDNICLTCFPDSYLTEMNGEYQTLTEHNFLSYLKQYPLDYIIWDKKIDPTWRMDRFGLPIVKDFGDITIFGMHKN